MLVRQPIKRRRNKKKQIVKKITVSYSVEFMQTKHIICKKAFLAMHGISSKRTLVALQKVTEGGSTIKDLRGKHPNPNAIPAEIVGYVHEHIQLLPVCSSHYTRYKNPNRQYLESSLTIRQLW